jgi:hypothetical protein
VGSSGKGPEKMIIVARADEDVSYLSLYFPDIPHTVYQVNLHAFAITLTEITKRAAGLSWPTCCHGRVVASVTFSDSHVCCTPTGWVDA